MKTILVHLSTTRSKCDQARDPPPHPKYQGFSNQDKLDVYVPDDGNIFIVFGGLVQLISTPPYHRFFIYNTLRPAQEVAKRPVSARGDGRSAG